MEYTSTIIRLEDSMLKQIQVKLVKLERGMLQQVEEDVGCVMFWLSWSGYTQVKDLPCWQARPDTLVVVSIVNKDQASCFPSLRWRPDWKCGWCSPW